MSQETCSLNLPLPQVSNIPQTPKLSDIVNSMLSVIILNQVKSFSTIHQFETAIFETESHYVSQDGLKITILPSARIPDTHHRAFLFHFENLIKSEANRQVKEGHTLVTRRHGASEHRLGAWSEVK